MATFNIVTVVKDVEEIGDEVGKLIAEFHEKLQAIGHKVTSVKVTGDLGTSDMTPREPESEQPAEDDEPVASSSTSSTISGGISTGS